jgi:hypothetical protein
LSDLPTTEKSWVGLGLNFALDGVRGISKPVHRSEDTRVIRVAAPQELATLLRRNGFHQFQIGQTADGTRMVEVENTAYMWNLVDAAGVAMAAIASTHGSAKHKFELVVSTRGVRQLLVKGDTGCLKRWLESGEACPVGVYSFNQFGARRAMSSQVRWQESGAPWWQALRPELVVSPAIASTIGTEVGSFDAHLGVNLGLMLPLWTGAVLDVSRQEPTTLRTRNFDVGGTFYASRIRPDTTRSLVHQFISLEPLNTSMRLSVGTAMSDWQGVQLETATQSDGGRYRIGSIIGRFEGKSPAASGVKTYGLYNYRHAWNDNHSITSELTAGEFWGGDTGFQFVQRFWHGDTVLALYARQTKMPSAGSISFAGLQISLPLTPRRNTSFASLGVRGTNQFSYGVETRVGAEDNRLLGGYGMVPRIGDSLAAQLLNRDRTTARYFETQTWRMREAFRTLYQQ